MPAANSPRPRSVSTHTTRDTIEKAAAKVKASFRRVSSRFHHHHHHDRRKSESAQYEHESESEISHVQDSSSVSTGSDVLNFGQESEERRDVKVVVGPNGSPIRHPGRVRQRLSSLLSPSTAIFPLHPSSADSSLVSRKKRRLRTASSASYVSSDYMSFSAAEDVLAQSVPARPPGVLAPDELRSSDPPAGPEASETRADTADAGQGVAPAAEPGLEASSVKATSEDEIVAGGDDDAPNPFLIDDPDDSEPATPMPPPKEEGPSPSPSHELPLEAMDVNKPVPPPPAASAPAPAVVSGSDSEPELPVLFLPQLILPTMFLPIPNVRLSFHLLWWYSKARVLY